MAGTQDISEKMALLFPFCIGDLFTAVYFPENNPPGLHGFDDDALAATGITESGR